MKFCIYGVTDISFNPNRTDRDPPSYDCHNIILITNFGFVRSVTLANFGRTARSTYAKLTIHVQTPTCTKSNTITYV